MHTFGRVGLAVLAAGMVAACTIIHPPAPSLPSRDSIKPGQTITVQGNQNVYAVAQQNHVSMREIIVLNNLQPPFTLRSGQQLVLPAGSGSGSYAGGGGYNSYGGSTNSPGYGPGTSAPTPRSANLAPVESATLAPVQTETLQPVELPPVQANPANNAPTPLAPLQTMPASSTTISPTTAAPWSSQPHKIGTTQTTVIDTLNAPATVSRPISTTVTAAASSSITSSSGSDTSSSSPISMIWPVQGPVISKFGPKGQGLNNDGVNIGAPKGSPVVAAANGIVVYAGSDMKGFGNLVLIRHQGGWVTAYAHLERMMVSKDAVVAQGDMIGTVGKTGNVPSPQLHFETRFKDKPVDPSGIVKNKAD